MEPRKKKEIYSYSAPWNVYGLNWSHRRDESSLFRLAVGSFVEEYTNRVDVIQYNEEQDAFVKVCGFEHPYPTTRIEWIPDSNSTHPDLVATSGDYLRIWNVENNVVNSKCVLNSNKKSEYCAPLTSFDWNKVDLNVIGTSSIDTTCTIWDIETEKSRTQLIAHDEEVYDFAFASGKDIFASASADGSIRMFDLRELEHSTIVYESQNKIPILRCEWNMQDPNYIACITMNSNQVVIVDIRVPNVPAAVLKGHKGCVNGLAWAPHSSFHICTASDDEHALIWDLKDVPSGCEEPILSYLAGEEINQLKWSTATKDWVSIAFSNQVQMLRV